MPTATLDRPTAATAQPPPLPMRPVLEIVRGQLVVPEKQWRAAFRIMVEDARRELMTFVQAREHQIVATNAEKMEDVAGVLDALGLSRRGQRVVIDKQNFTLAAHALHATARRALRQVGEDPARLRDCKLRYCETTSMENDLLGIIRAVSCSAEIKHPNR